MYMICNLTPCSAQPGQDQRFSFVVQSYGPDVTTFVCMVWTHLFAGTGIKQAACAAAIDRSNGAQSDCLTDQHHS